MSSGLDLGIGSEFLHWQEESTSDKLSPGEGSRGEAATETSSVHTQVLLPMPAGSASLPKALGCRSTLGLAALMRVDGPMPAPWCCSPPVIPQGDIKLPELDVHSCTSCKGKQ